MSVSCVAACPNLTHQRAKKTKETTLGVQVQHRRDEKKIASVDNIPAELPPPTILTILAEHVNRG